MSKVTLELLRGIGFLDKRNNPVNLDTVDDEWINSRLSHYFDARSRTVENELSELPGTHQSSFMALVSSVSAINAVVPLLPSFLLYDHIITDDPLFREATPDDSMGSAQKRAFGMAVTKSVDRPSIARRLSYFSTLAPVIDAGFLDVLPLSLLHLPSDGIPLFYAEDRFRSEIPDGIHDFIHARASIREVVPDKATGAFRLIDRPNPERKRAIHVSFAGDTPPYAGMTYFFQTMTPVGSYDGSGMLQVAFECDLESPLAEDVYQGWVYQSVNRTILARLQEVGSEVAIARHTGHVYLTESEFEAKLIGAATTPLHAKSICDGVNFLRANNTLLAVDDASMIVRLRERNQHAFERFRASLTALSGDLAGVSPTEFPVKAQQAFLTQVQPQIDEIQRLAAAITASVAKGALISLGGVALAIVSGSTIPFISAALCASAGGLSETLPVVSDYLQKHQSPEFIWSQLRR